MLEKITKESILGFISNLGFVELMLLTTGILIVLDALMAFRYYYLNKYYTYLDSKLEEKRLKYLIESVIAGYQSLGKESEINKLIKKVRALEQTLGKYPKDFTEYKSQYEKNIKDVSTRRYL